MGSRVGPAVTSSRGIAATGATGVGVVGRDVIVHAALCAARKQLQRGTLASILRNFA